MIHKKKKFPLREYISRYFFQQKDPHRLSSLHQYEFYITSKDILHEYTVFSICIQIQDKLIKYEQKTIHKLLNC